MASALAASALLLLSTMAGSASAAPPLLTQFPENITAGAGANQLAVPKGIGADQSSGRLYIAEVTNNRVSVFDPWGVFVEAWGWGVNDGAEALQRCGPAEPELSPPPGLCQAGISGSGAGQMNSPVGIAVDSTGNVYVLERNNRRIQKFDPSGDFLLMFGGEVNKTTAANVCTKADIEGGDECGAGVEGTEDGFFTRPSSFAGGYIAVDDDDSVYVGDLGRIQVFEPNGTHEANLPLAESDTVGALTFDRNSGDLYFSYFKNSITSEPDPSIFRIDADTGAILDTLTVEAPTKLYALANDPDGRLYVSIDGNGAAKRIVAFDSGGNPVISPDENFALLEATQPGEVANLNALATNSVGDLYIGENLTGGLGHRSAVSVYGPPPIELGPPPAVPPVIAGQFASSVGTTGATVRARINPRFWADTAFYVEYGPEDCEVSECSRRPVSTGLTLTDQVVNTPLVSGGVFLGGLSPATTYHYRFVAESGGGGPVIGADRTFTTSPTPAAQPACPNDAFRPGPAAYLPDCRAYEMVSPVDKNGADISVVFSVQNQPAGLNQIAPNGNAITYSAYRAFGEVESAPYTSQYVAVRGGGGWSSASISPPREGASIYATQGLDSQYKGFSEDLCMGWLLQDTRNSLAPGSLAEWPNVYRRDVCGGGYTQLAPEVEPTVPEVNDFRPEIQGFSADGSKALILAKGKLTADAGTARQVYEASGGEPLRLVCVLPSGVSSKSACTAGTAGTSPAPDDRAANVQHAISEDGSAIYWTSSEKGPGKLYVRVSHATTTQVSTGEARFWGATASDGSAALYSEGGNLRRFDLASKSSEPIAGGFAGMLGVSDDADVAYFVSTDELAPGGEAGQPNLYRYEDGSPPSFTFIGILAEEDLSGEYSPVDNLPVRHLAQVSPDGGALAFMSRAGLTGYDNTDGVNGELDAEVFLYRADGDSLVCVSCNPTGASPAGQLLGASLWTAGQIPAAENQLSTPQVVSDDGTRLFFESYDPLAVRDTNGVKDVYEWEALGAGNCAEGGPGYREVFEGCVNLISSGESPEDSELVGASADGRDVFFKTESSLLPQDPGLVDIYNARAGGGYPLPAPPPPACQGEACQNPAGAPSDPTPSSQSFVGPGNRLYCPKGRHRVVRQGKERCVKNKRRVKTRKHGRHARSKRAAKKNRAAKKRKAAKERRANGRSKNGTQGKGRSRR